MQIENADRIIKGELPPSALGVEAKNSHTLVVHLSKPVPYLLQMLINWRLSPIIDPQLRNTVISGLNLNI